MNRSAILGAVSLLLILSWGCKDNSVNGNVAIAIQNELNVALWETLSPNNRTFHFHIATIESSSCEDAVIDFDQFAESGEVSITLKDITLNDCSTPSTFPATANIEIGTLESIEYDLEINLTDLISNSGLLIVDESYYEIKMNNQDGLTIDNMRLNRVPENTIWGYAARKNSDTPEYAVAFVNDLKSVGTDHVFEEGYYGYFSVQNNNLNILTDDFPDRNLHTFGLSFDGDTVELENVINQYRMTYPDIIFKIFTSEGGEL